MIYLDNAATYINDDASLNDVYFKARQLYPANSNSSHRLGYITNKALDDARKEILTSLKLNNEYDVIFNSGASEGISHAIKGYARANKNRGNEIIVFKNEHPAVYETVHSLSKEGFKIIEINCDEIGEILYQDIEKNINNHTILVAVMSVNNEVGSINDINKISAIVKKYPKCVFFSDVTQSIGKINLDYSKIDMFACSAHKFGGFIGSGILIKKRKIILEKMINGGVQENNYRSGTVATPLALSTTYALKKAIKELDAHYKAVDKLKNALLDEIKNNEEIVINSNSSFPYIANISLKHKKASVVIEALSSKEIYVSSLSACNAHKNQVSHVLINMGKSKQLADNSIRISFSYINTVEEIKVFTKELNKVIEVIR